MATKKPKSTEVVAYKAFDPDFSCRGHKYEVGQSYEVEGKLKFCNNGFHACENPWDTLKYYELVCADGSLTRFGKVSVSGEIARDNTKLCAAKITVEAEIGLPGFVKAGVDWLIAATKGKDGLPDNGGDYAQIGSSGNHARIGSSGNHAQIGSSGNCAQIGSSGNHAQIGSSGYYARIGSSGYHARIGSSGNHAQIGSSGYYARIGSSGYYARIGSSGNHAQIGSSGYYARIGSSGNHAQIVCEGENAVVASAGFKTIVSGKKGAWVSLAEYVEGKCVGFASGCIGKDGLEPDTPYKAEGGKLVKA